MRILEIDPAPMSSISYRNAAPGGGETRARLPIHVAHVDRLPDGLAALVATADLQGRMGSGELLGSALPARLAPILRAQGLADLAGCGILVCGDLYARPGNVRRGGAGDVCGVWQSLAAGFRWVAGVAGNHDRFGEHPDQAIPLEFLQAEGRGYLDGGTVTRDGLCIGGVGGVIGASGKPFRRSEEEFMAAVDGLLAEKPDILLCHDGPDAPPAFLGIAAFRELLERWPHELLVVRGHAHWDSVLVQLTPTCQVLNVDARVVVLVREGAA